MPNTPVLVQKGVSVFVPGSAVTNEDITVINKLLQSVGTSDQVSEELLDVVTALSGSGPAYVSPRKFFQTLSEPNIYSLIYGNWF